MANSIVNQTLTTYAKGLMADRTQALADFIAPVVSTGVAHGMYKAFNDQQAFQAYSTGRAVGGKRTRILFEDSDAYYNCVAKALEIAIDDHERDSAGDQLALEQAKIQTLLTNVATARELDVFTKIKAAVSATASIGVWSTATNDPVAEIDQVIETIATKTGQMPNRIVLGLAAWRALKNHTLVRARFPGAPVAGVSQDQIKGIFLNPNMEIRVGVLPYDTKKVGGTKTNSNIVGAEVFVFYASDTPSVYDPSAVKTFRVSGTGIEAVKQYREESCASDVLAVDYAEDVIVTATDSIARITVS